MSETSANHPFIGSLVKKMDQITYCLVIRDFDPALRGMLSVFLSLKIEDKNSRNGVEFWDLMCKARSARDSVEDTDPLVLRRKLMTFDDSFEKGYEELFNGLSEILWQGGYYSDDLYKKAIPLAGDNISGTKDREGLPKTMSSRVE